MLKKVLWPFALVLLILGIDGVEGQIPGACIFHPDFPIEFEVRGISCEIFHDEIFALNRDTYKSVAIGNLTEELSYRIIVQKETDPTIIYLKVIGASFTYRTEIGFLCAVNDDIQKIECPDKERNNFIKNMKSGGLISVSNFNYDINHLFPSEEKWHIEVREYLIPETSLDASPNNNFPEPSEEFRGIFEEDIINFGEGSDEFGEYISRHFRVIYQIIKPEAAFYPEFNGLEITKPVTLEGAFFNSGFAPDIWVKINIINEKTSEVISSLTIDSLNPESNTSINWGDRGTPIGSWSFDFDPSEFSDGTYTITAEGCGMESDYNIVCGDVDSLQVTLPSPTLIDDSPPILTNKQPRDGRKINERRPLIAITANDPESGIDVSNLELKINGNDVKANFDYDSNIVSHKPQNNLDFGVQNISVKVFNNEGLSSTESWSFTLTEEPLPELPPNAELSVASNRGEGPLEVDFSYNCEKVDISLKTCRLDFGDGNYIDLQVSHSLQAVGDISYTYPIKDGAYNAILTARDYSGNETYDTIRIYSEPPANKPPEIYSITAIPQFSTIIEDANIININEGEGIEYFADAIDPEGKELTYFWDFGDGEIESEGGDNIYHSYYFKKGETKETYTVTLTVSDGELEVSKEIEVIVEKALMTVKVSVPLLEDGPITKGNLFEVKIEITDIDGKRILPDNIQAYLNESTNLITLTEDSNEKIYRGNKDSSVFTNNTGHIFVVASGYVKNEMEISGTVYKVDFSPAEMSMFITTIPEIPAVGSTLENINIRLDYPNQMPVNKAVVIARIEGSDLGNIVFSETASGIYEAELEYGVRPEDSGGLILMLKAKDEFGNGSNEFRKHRIETNPLNAWLNAWAGVITILFAIAIGGYYIIQRVEDRRLLKEGLASEQFALEKELKQLKIDYHKRQVSEKCYKSRVLECEQQLATVNVLLGTEKVSGEKLSGEEQDKRKEKILCSLRKEQREVNVLVNRLKRKTKQFSRMEMKKAILNEGYSNKIAEKVIDTLYKAGKD